MPRIRVTSFLALPILGEKRSCVGKRLCLLLLLDSCVLFGFFYLACHILPRFPARLQKLGHMPQHLQRQLRQQLPALHLSLH